MSDMIEGVCDGDGCGRRTFLVPSGDDDRWLCAVCAGRERAERVDTEAKLLELLRPRLCAPCDQYGPRFFCPACAELWEEARAGGSRAHPPPLRVLRLFNRKEYIVSTVDDGGLIGGSIMAEGFVYVLVSANSEFVKIGRTEKTPFHRLREINLSLNYAGSGPWDVSDFRQVKDCAAVESQLAPPVRGQARGN